jgi:hypothetical protein
VVRVLEAAVIDTRLPPTIRVRYHTNGPAYF